MIIYGGIDIGGTSIKIGFVDKAGTILCKDLMPVGKITAYNDFIEQLGNKTNNLLETLDNKDAIIGFGVGCPGRIDVATGKVIWLRGKHGKPVYRTRSCLRIWETSNLRQ